MPRTRKAELLTEVILAVFQTNGRLLASGDVLVRPLGLTSARWQVLGAIALSKTALSAPQIAAVMGITRQGAQKQINLLIAEGLLSAKANPSNKRSPLYTLTKRAERVYAELDQLQARWASDLAEGLAAADLATAKRVLDLLSERLTTSSNQRTGP